MRKAFQKMREIRGQPDVDHDRARRAAHEVSIGGAVLETDLIDVLRRLNQGTDVGIQQRDERARLAVVHEVAALNWAALEARSRLLSASMIISANAGCWLTRYTKRAWLIRITLVFGAAAIAVAERDEPSITAISPKNSPLPRVTMVLLLAPLTLAISTLPSSTTNSSRPVEPSSKMTSSTSNSLMHFSMAMVSPAFWLVRLAMLVGKCDGANDASGRFTRVLQGSIDQVRAPPPRRVTPCGLKPARMSS